MKSTPYIYLCVSTPRREMRLLNTTTYELVDEIAIRKRDPLNDPQQLVVYAILSHTWGEEEVTYSDIQNLESALKLAGFAKLESACALAFSQGYEFIWIDTCCIDKTSSAELSEAINSMYRWYEEADICYAYLADVEIGANWRVSASGTELFAKSRWFERGWTLQELIAPVDVEFYSRTWLFLGSKSNLQKELHEVTHIDQFVLGGGIPACISVSRRLYWASHRKTTREEDEAYCLLGLFGVHLPPIYGEGREKAFLRLQESILKSTDDQSIFAWGVVHTEKSASDYRDGHLLAMLAQTLWDFRESFEISPNATVKKWRNFATTTSAGLSTKFMISEKIGPDGMRYDAGVEVSHNRYIILDCQFGPTPLTFPAIRSTWTMVGDTEEFLGRSIYYEPVRIRQDRGRLLMSTENLSTNQGN